MLQRARVVIIGMELVVRFGVDKVARFIVALILVKTEVEVKQRSAV